MKINILAFAAHPDDAELGCGGTLYKHKQLGFTTGIIDLTAGELGTRGSSAIRAEEANKASQILLLDVRENLGFDDGFFSNDRQHLMPIIRKIRTYQPDIALVNAIEDRHPDHARASKLVSDACFYAGLSRIETMDDLGVPQLPWRPKAVYHYIQYHYIKPDFVIDISDSFDIKMQSVQAFSSQFYNPNSLEPETAISTKAFIEGLGARCSELGRMIGVPYAEGYTTERITGVNNLFHLL